MANTRILFVWSGLNGYMGDCWRELARRDGVDVKVVVDVENKYFGGSFNPEEVLRGLDWQTSLPSLVNSSWKPDVVFIVGWHNKMCRIAASMDWDGAKKVCCFDMPWEWKLRKVFARFVLWRYLRKFDMAFVPGAASLAYARWLGFGRERIFTGLYGTNTNRFSEHCGGKGLLFVGRDAPEKGLDVLRKAHEAYKASGGTWDLRIVNGVAPDSLGKIYADADCFVLPSRWEPWGVVLVEAAAAGLPVICTDKCGARHEVVRGTGFVVNSGDAKALADAIKQISGMGRKEREALGGVGKALAAQYSCEAWADRVISICDKLID